MLQQRLHNIATCTSSDCIQHYQRCKEYWFLL